MDSKRKMQNTSPQSALVPRSTKEKVNNLEKRFGALFRAAKFGIAGIVGFFVAELILTIGVYELYHNLNVQSSAYASPTLLELNVLAFGIGVTVSFFINEKITVNNEAEQKKSQGAKNTIIRLLKFQLVYLAGNAVTIGVQ